MVKPGGMQLLRVVAASLAPALGVGASASAAGPSFDSVFGTTPPWGLAQHRTLFERMLRFWKANL